MAPAPLPPTSPVSPAAPGSSASPDRSVWRIPGFTRFWLARVALTGAYQMLSVAVGWQMYAISGSAFDLGLVGLLQFLPRMALVLVAGSVVDRFERRDVVALSMAVQAIAAALLLAAAQGWGLQPGRGLILGLSALVGACRAFDTPGMQAMLPALVPEQALARAIALAASATQAASVIAPAVGGLLYALGPGFGYGLTGAVDALGVALLISLPRVHAAVRAPITLDSMLEGVRYIRAHTVVLGAISLDLFAVLLGGATALLPVYASDILHIGPWGLGMLRACPAVGALLTAAWLARHPVERHAGRLMFSAVAVFGVATIVFGLSRWVGLSMLALAVLGGSDVISVVIRGTLVQLQTPDALRGRVNAVNSLFIGASNQLGEFESGFTAAWFGAVPAVVLGGLGTLAVVLLWRRMFPALARYDGLC
jgi:MFS family permease